MNQLWVKKSLFGVTYNRMSGKSWFTVGPVDLEVTEFVTVCLSILAMLISLVAFFVPQTDLGWRLFSVVFFVAGFVILRLTLCALKSLKTLQHWVKYHARNPIAYVLSRFFLT